VGIDATKRSLVAGRFQPGCDRMLIAEEFEKCQAAVGRFTIDGASLNDGSNSHCKNFCCPDKPFEQATIRGHNVFLNGPFDDRLAVMLEHYCREKAEDPYNTSGCFVVPKWRGNPWQKYLAGMQVLKRYPKGSRIFMAINEKTGNRELMPGIPWEVLVYWDPRKRRPRPRVALNTVVDESSHVGVSTTVSMEVKGRFAGASCNVLFDSGSREHSFISEAFVRREGVPISPHTDVHVVAYDGRVNPAVGTVKAKLSLPGLNEMTKLIVVTMDADLDIILGSDWLTAHKAKLDYEEAVVTAKTNNKTLTISANRWQGPSMGPERVGLRSRPSKARLLTFAQVKRFVRKQARMFMVSVKKTEPVDEHADVADIRELLEHGKSPSISGKGLVDQSLIDGLVDDFQDVLREPPPGLPKERRTVHTIPTLDGAQPPYRPPFR
jgi:hypothetical protein